LFVWRNNSLLMVYSLASLAFVIAWLLPGHYFPWHNFQQEVAAALGAVLLALAALVSPQVGRIKVPWIAAFALVLAVVPWLQWFTGRVHFFADALLPSLYLCAFAMTVMASRALAHADGERFVGSIFTAVLLGAFLSMAIGLVQWLQLGPVAFMENMPNGGRVYANFTQPNHLACLLGLGISPVIWLHERRHVRGATALLALGFLAWGLVMTQSRVAIAIVAMYFCWWFIGLRRVPLRTPMSAGVGALFLFTGLAMLWAPINSELGTVARSVVDRVQSAGTRAIHWPALWDAATREPWFGWGWMQVGAAQQAVALDHPVSHEWITYSHNLLLDLWVWNGLLIGSAAIATIGLWALTRCVACRDATTWALLAAGGTITVYAMAEFPHAYTFFLLLLAVLVGAVEAKHDAGGAERAVPKWAYALPSAGMAGLLTLICFDYLEVEEASRRTPRPPDVVLLDNQRELVWFRLTHATPGMAEQDLKRMKALSLRYMPPPVMLRYALASGLNGQPQEAARSLRLICNMWPQRNCDEGASSWRALQSRYPELKAIEFPSAGQPDYLSTRSTIIEIKAN
jgi:hypothetical protein